MASVARDRVGRDKHQEPHDEAVAPPAVAPVLVAQRPRALTAALDGARFRLTHLVRSVAERLTTEPSQVSLASVEVDVRDTLFALGGDLLTELVRLRGTGYRGPSYVGPCGVRLVLKELAPLQQRTCFGTLTLQRAVYAGEGCQERAHHVPLDAEWALLGAIPVPTVPTVPPALPDPDGGTLLAVAPGPGPARRSPALAALVVEFGARLPFAEAARRLALVLGAPAPLAPNTVGTYTKAAGHARAQQENALRVRTTPPTRAARRAVFDQPPSERPPTAPETLVITLDGALERTDQGWKEGKLGAVSDLVPRATRALADGLSAASTAVTTAGAVGASTSTATLEGAPTFGRQLLAVAHRRGVSWARQVVVLGDGAKWIWKLAARRFPQATQVVDWYHAREQLWALAQLLYGEGTATAWTWLETLAGELWTAQTADEVAVVPTAAGEAWATPRKEVPEGTPQRTQARHREVTKAVAYFTANASRMRYGAFREAGLPVGSGVGEGGCQSVLHTRLTRPGACWRVDSAAHLVRARAVLWSDPAPACPHPWDRLAS